MWVKSIIRRTNGIVEVEPISVATYNSVRRVLDSVDTPTRQVKKDLRHSPGHTAS